MIVDLLEFLGHVLYPSPLPGAPPEFVRWQYGLSGTLWAFIVAVGVHISIACGFFTSLGVSGFALAGDVGDLAKAIKSNEVVQLEEAIPNDKQQQCQFQQQKNVAAVRFATGVLYAHLDRYWQLTGRPYRLPSCDEL